MERKTYGEDVHRISISKLKQIFADASLKSDNLIMSPLIRFQSLDDTPRIIDGITIGIICNGKARITINGRTHELRTNSLVLLREDSVVTAFKCSKACRGYLMTYSRNFLDSINIPAADFLSIYMIFSTMPCISLTDEEASHLHRVGELLADADATREPTPTTRVSSRRSFRHSSTPSCPASPPPPRPPNPTAAPPPTPAGGGSCPCGAPAGGVRAGPLSPFMPFNWPMAPPFFLK